MCIWIKDYAVITCPLVDLTCKGVDFQWEDRHEQAMQQLKDAIVRSPALIPIDYSSSRPVFLTIDSSWRAVGWILSQECEDGQCRPSRFGSITWNECESHYLQPKIELYGLFQTLCALQVHIIGITNLVVEMDAQYVRRMLCNPDMQPNTAINRWIPAISLFDFKLVHIPTEMHTAPDGLSHCEPVPGEDNSNDNPKEWIDNILSLGFWTNTHLRSQHPLAQIFQALARGAVTSLTPNPTPTPTSDCDTKLERICAFLADPTLCHIPLDEREQLIKHTCPFFTRDG